MRTPRQASRVTVAFRLWNAEKAWLRINLLFEKVRPSVDFAYKTGKSKGWNSFFSIRIFR